MPIEITKRYVRVRKMSPALCKPGSFRTISIGSKGSRMSSSGDKAVICRPFGMSKSRIQSVLHRRKK